MKKLTKLSSVFLAALTLTVTSISISSLISNTPTYSSYDANIEEETPIEFWYVSQKQYDDLTQTADIELTVYVNDYIYEEVYYTTKKVTSTTGSGDTGDTNLSNRVQLTSSEEGVLEPGVYQFWINDLDFTTPSTGETHYYYVNLFIGDEIVDHTHSKDDTNMASTRISESTVMVGQESYEINIRGYDYQNNSLIVEMATETAFITTQTGSDQVINDNGNSDDAKYTTMYDVEMGESFPGYGLPLYTGLANWTYQTFKISDSQSNNVNTQAIEQDADGSISLRGFVGDSSSYDAAVMGYLTYNISTLTQRNAIDNIRASYQENTQSITITYDQNWESQDVWLYVGTDNTPTNEDWLLIEESNYDEIQGNGENTNYGAYNNKTYTLEKTTDTNEKFLANTQYYVQMAYGGTDATFDGTESVSYDSNQFSFTSAAGQMVESEQQPQVSATSATFTFEVIHGEEFTEATQATYVLYKGKDETGEIVEQQEVDISNEGIVVVELFGLNQGEEYYIEFYYDSYLQSTESFATGYYFPTYWVVGGAIVIATIIVIASILLYKVLKNKDETTT